MGVPKFFRYMSERYPCLSEFVKEYQIPEFDNLYLDMNGIIHMCSHPDDNNPHFRITEEKLFSDIFHYIEVLFRMIKPLKVFFMAIDGVAPRAKMNQQRGRRFRSAKDAEKLEQEAIKKGEKLPDVARFDSNCITPGTEFMAKLHEQLKYFVVKKISTDKLWKKCKVILSGHETPGEGEHKIMDYIRYIRAQPGYDPNTRHCLYGLDADLIMLGLCTHDPHFSLLREEVTFGKKSSKRNNVPEQIRFYLLHLSLMREYLELEFEPLKHKLKNASFQFDIEKIIDDWILMGFLVGNDFIPNLPDLHIVHGALPILYNIYMDVLPTLDGYINECGTLNLPRFEKFMQSLAELDKKNFEEKRADLQYMSAKTGRKVRAHAPNIDYKSGKELEDFSEVDAPRNIDPALAALIQQTDDLDIDSDEDDETYSSDSDFNLEFKSFKKEYYRNKLEFSNVTREVMQDQAEGYVRAIQWNLNYYYNGCCSWSWYYQHHYAPYISDIKGFSNLKIEFELGQPFKPFEQLLAVLPTGSKDLLPKAYHDLMCNENSLIKEYYPDDFQTDLNGKRQEWEAVVLVPFIDEKVLLEAMKPCNELLTAEEAKRNSHGPMLIYNYVDDDLGVYEAPNYFPKIVSNHAFCDTKLYNELCLPKEQLVKGAYPGAKFDVFYPGFPTLKHLPYTSKLKVAKVKVFEHPSKCENMVLSLLPKKCDDLPEELLGTVVWVGWPHLIEGRVVAVSNCMRKLTYREGKDPECIPNSEKIFQMEYEGVDSYYMSRWGVDFGEIEVLVHVNVMTGRRYICTPQGRVNLEKQFSHIVSIYPFQAVVTNIAVHDSCHTTYRDIKDLFPVGSQCFSLSHPYYGSIGTILESPEALQKGQLKVALSVYEEPNLIPCLRLHEKLGNMYQTAKRWVPKLSLSPQAFQRITGTLLMHVPYEDRTINIGLDLKFNRKNKETPDYTKRLDNLWLYTEKTVNLVRDYYEMFPEIFDYLAKSRHDDDMHADRVFKDEWSEKVKELKTWLRSLPTHNVERRVCDSDVLDEQVIKAIEQAVDDNLRNQKPKQLTLQIKPQLLFKPDIQFGNLDPDKNSQTHTFDRVVNIKECSVPLGLKGTVIGVHKPAGNDETDEEVFDILFDERFDGGMTINSSESRVFRLQKINFINLSHGKRQMENQTGKPGALLAMAKEQQQAGYNFRINQSGNQFNNGRPQNSAFVSFNKNNHGPMPTHRQQLPPQRVVQQPHQNNASKKNIDFMPSFNSPTKSHKEYTPQTNKPPIQIYKGEPSTSSGFFPQPTQHPPVDPSLFLKKILQVDSSNTSSTTFPPYNMVPPMPMPKLENSASKLMQFYQSRGLGCPKYSFINRDNGKVSARIILPDGKMINSPVLNTKPEASESAARIALDILNKPPIPQKFPIPPQNWVQTNGVNGQVFFNKFQQERQIAQNKSNPPGNNVHKPQPRKPIQQNNQKKTSGQNFVPLQAITKRPVKTNSGNNSHASNSATNAHNSSNERKDRRQIVQENNTKGQQADTKPRSDNSQKKRRMRIAANFKTDKQ